MTAQKWMWEVDDGETHLVVAYSGQHAIEIVVKTFEHGSVDEYMAEYEPVVKNILMPTPIKCNIAGEVATPRHVPKHSRIFAEATAQEWCDSMEPGIATTTVY